MSGSVVTITVYFGIAIGLALALVLMLGLALHAGARVKHEPSAWVFYLIILAVMALPVLTERVLAGGLAYAEATIEEIGGSFWISRFLTLGVLALCAERLLRFMFRREWGAVKGWPLCIAFLVFAVSSHLVNGAFGAHPSFDHKALYALIVFPAVFIAAQREPERFFRFARGALMLFFVASAVAAGLKSSMVIERGYAAGFPGLTFRYYGLATHANTIGPLAITAMICLWRFPLSSRWLNLAAWGLVGGSLLLSQSKTSIAIAAVIGAFLVLYRYRDVLSSNVPGGTGSASILYVALGCLLIAVGGLGVIAASDSLAYALQRWDVATGGHLSTLTGRTRIWGLAWHEFTSSPLFGYGPSIWSPVYRVREGVLFASHAHNQYLQALSSAGLVGFLSLVIYLGVLTVHAIRATARSGGVSLALLMLVLLRTITEVPLSVGGVMQAEFYIHLLLLAACVGFAPGAAQGSAAGATVATGTRNVGERIEVGSAVGR